MASIFSTVLDRLAMLDPDYAADKRANSRIAKEYELRGGLANQEAQLREGLLAKEYELRGKERAAGTNETLRLAELQNQAVHNAKREALANTYIGQPSPITGEPMPSAEAFQRAESELAKAVAQLGVTEPAAVSRSRTSAADLETEGATAARPYEANRAITAQQSAIAGNVAKKDLGLNTMIEAVADRPFVQERTAARSRADTAKSELGASEAQALKPFVNSLRSLQALKEVGGLEYDLLPESVARSREAAAAKLAADTAEAKYRSENPGLSAGVLSSLIRERAAVDAANIRAGTSGGSKSLDGLLGTSEAPTTKGAIKLSDIEAWAAAKAGAPAGTNAAPVGVSPAVVQKILADTAAAQTNAAPYVDPLKLRLNSLIPALR